MNFWVVQVAYNGAPRSALSNLYASPFQAETDAEKYRRRNPHYTYAVRPATWQEREQNMFDAEVYQPPVWARERFWLINGHYFTNHFVHVSLVDEQSIAFTEDARKGEADRQTLMRPGKYLQKFCGAGPDGMIAEGPMKGEFPIVTKQQIAFYAEWHKVGVRPMNDDDELRFTEDPDEMIRVYEEGPDSCMMGKGWVPKDHPVQVYAAGDLHLAYLIEKATEKVLGRALCWPAKEVFGRVYPTPNNEEAREKYDDLMARLKAKGWTSIDEKGSVFEGARLVQKSNRYGSWIMPYLDHSYGVREVYKNGESYWEMTRSEPHQENTDGTYYDSDPEPDWHCDNCGDGFSDDDSAVTVYRSWRPNPGTRGGGRPYYDAAWCEHCSDNGTFYCEGSDERYDESCTDSIECGYTTYERHWFEANGGYQCSWEEEFYFRDDQPAITLADGSLVAECNLKEAAFQCLWDGQWWPKDYSSEVVPGYSLNADCVEVHPIEYEYVLPHIPEDADEGMATQAMLSHDNDNNQPLQLAA